MGAEQLGGGCAEAHLQTYISLANPSAVHSAPFTPRTLANNMGVAQPVLVCAVLLGLLTQTPAAATPDEGQPLSIQDIVSFLDYLQDKGMNLETAGARERGFRKPEAFLENYQDDLKTNEIGSREGDAMSINKRASYMTLCHFKICNMGRKRGFFRKASHNFLRRI